MRSKIFFGAILIILLSLGGVNLGWADPSFLGTTGLIRVPSAEVLAPKGYNLGFFWMKLKDKDSKSHSYSFNYGLKGGIEVGGMTLEQEEESNQVLLQVKYKVSEEIGNNPAISVGVIYDPDTKEAEGRKDEISYYAIASQSLGWPRSWVKKYKIRGHLGIGSQIFEGAFGGIEVSLNPQTNLIAEYDSQQFNFGLRFAISPGIIFKGVKVKEDYGLGVIVQVGGR